MVIYNYTNTLKEKIMDFKDIWNFIVNKHESDKNKDERVVQESWETYFSEFFGYKKL